MTTSTTHVRAALSERLLLFGADRSIQTRELQRRIDTLDPDGGGASGLQAALSAARVWESAVLWLAWRLQPRTTTGL